jgi:hypothetical protein
VIALLLACAAQKESPESPLIHPVVEASAPSERPLLGVEVQAPVAPVAIEVLAPAPDTVLTPGQDLRVQGKATVWEGALVVELLASDELMAKELVTASSAAPGRGSFEVSIPVPEGQSGGPWRLRVYSSSPKDGAPINTVEVPLSGP